MSHNTPVKDFAEILLSLDTAMSQAGGQLTVGVFEKTSLWEFLSQLALNNIRFVYMPSMGFIKENTL